MANPTVASEVDKMKKNELPDLAAEIAELRKELETLGTRVGRIGSAGVAEAKGAARDGIDRGLTLGAHLADEFKSDLDAVEARILAEAREKPWRTIGVAALGGLVLGLFLRR